jgi:hypothetical protein
MRITWSPQAAIQALVSLKHGVKHSTEVSTALVIVPTNAYLELPPSLLDGSMTYPQLSEDYPDLYVLYAFVPKQRGNSVESHFEYKDALEEFNLRAKNAYPFLNDGFIKGWLHNHPGGVSPSNADLSTFGKRIEMNPAYYLMTIYDPSFTDSKIHLHNRVFMNTSIIVPDVVPVTQANKENVTGVVINNGIKVVPNPFIKPYTISDNDGSKVITSGMFPSYWRTMYPVIYKKAMSYTNVTGIVEIYDDSYNTGPLTIVGTDYIAKQLEVISYMHRPAKTYKKESYEDWKDILPNIQERPTNKGVVLRLTDNDTKRNL